MFRFSIRELFLLTLVVAMAVGWGIDRRSLVAKVEAGREASEEARMLAHLTSPDAMLCGQEAIYLMQLREKYGASTRSLFKVIEELDDGPDLPSP